MNNAERKEDEAKWEEFAKRLGYTIDDIKKRSRAGVMICDKTCLPDTISQRFRDRILEKTTWRDQDKPKLEVAG